LKVQALAILNNMVITWGKHERHDNESLLARL
jgi:hypothetical protein